MPDAPAKVIFIVEDDREIRAALVELLKFEGFAVHAANDGQQGLDQLRQGLRPDLIILDLMMPVKNGAQFREEQLKDPTIAEIPVIVLSADANIHAVSERLGIRRYLRKPVNLEDLLESVLSTF
jgi:CheY-like chemotaxis protein